VLLHLVPAASIPRGHREGRRWLEGGQGKSRAASNSQNDREERGIDIKLRQQADELLTPLE
jgi:hypothetical protein